MVVDTDRPNFTVAWCATYSYRRIGNCTFHICYILIQLLQLWDNYEND